MKETGQAKYFNGQTIFILAIYCILLVGCGKDDGMSSSPGQLSIDKTLLDFGVVPITTTSTPKFITLRNTGGSDLVISSLSFEPQGNF